MLRQLTFAETLPSRAMHLERVARAIIGRPLQNYQVFVVFDVGETIEWNCVKAIEATDRRINAQVAGEQH